MRLVFGTDDAAMQTDLDAVRIFGWYGCARFYRVQKLMRDAHVLQIYWGTSEIQWMIVACTMMAM